MSFVLQPWQLILVILAGWINQLQQQIIEFQRTEIELLKMRLGKKRIVLNDDERRVLVLSNNIIRRQPTEDATAGSAVFGLVLGFQAAHGHRSHFMYVLTPLRVARQIGSPLPVQAARA